MYDAGQLVFQAITPGLVHSVCAKLSIEPDEHCRQPRSFAVRAPGPAGTRFTYRTFWSSERFDSGPRSGSSAPLTWYLL